MFHLIRKQSHIAAHPEQKPRQKQNDVLVFLGTSKLESDQVTSRKG